MMVLHLRGVRERSLVTDSRNGLLEVMSTDYWLASCGYNNA